MERVLKLVARDQHPLIVFIDDLDRCSPRVVIQMIEAINLFLAGEFESCIFVLAMEPDIVAAHVEVAYSDLVEKLGKRGQAGALGWRFLEKIVQLPLSLPAVDRTREIPDYLRAQFDLPASTHLAAGQLIPPGPQVEPRREASESAPPGTENAANNAPHAPIQTPIASPDPMLIDRVEMQIRARHPTLDSLPEVVRELENQLPSTDAIALTIPTAEMSSIAELAADRVFTDLYSDNAAYEVIAAALPALNSTNPREIRRYLNLFRFYAFIAFRRRLQGTPEPDNTQIAKIAVLAIRWPHLLGAFASEDSAGATVLQGLENAARMAGDEVWNTTAKGDPADTLLRAFLQTDPPIADVSRGII